MKKIVNLVKVVIVVLCACVTMACSGCNGGDEPDTDRYTYREFDLQNGKEYIYDTFFRDNIFYYTSCMIDDYDEEDNETQPPEDNHIKLHSYNIDSGEDTILCEIRDENRICEGIELGSGRGFYITDQNQIKMVWESNISDGLETHTEINVITVAADGIMISVEPIADKIAAVWDGECKVDETNDIRFGQDGQLYLTCEVHGSTYIVRCDTEGNVTGSIPYDKEVDGLFTDNENKMAVISYNLDGVDYIYLDFDKGECGETHSIQDEEGVYKFGSGAHGDFVISSKLFSGCGDVTCYINDSAGLCAYNVKEQSITPLFGWNDTGIVGEFVENIIAVGDGRMICECREPNSNKSYGFIERSEEGTKKTVIKCAALSTESDYQHTLEKKIIDYNKKSEDYRVELVTYEKSGSPINAFAQDIIAGNIPDVVDISGVDVDSYISQGFFEDLAPYMENDDEFGKDYYVDGLYDAISVDGKQYYAVEKFRFQTVAAKASDTEQYKDGWTMEDMIEYYHSKPEGTMLHMYDSKNEIFENYVAPFIDDYIDWDTGKVYFDSDEFRAAAAFCNEFPSDFDFGQDYNDVAKQMREGVILTNLVGAMDDFQLSRALFDEDFRCIGFPSADKKKAYITPLSTSLAITSSSEEKEGAWDFVKSAITGSKDYAFSDGLDGWLPSGKKDFERIIKKETATEKYTDEDGTIVRPHDGTQGINDFEYEMRPFSEDEINVIRGLIKDSVVKNDNSSVLFMVENELNSYFRGYKTLDETVRVLQDRVGKYVNENK